MNALENVRRRFSRHRGFIGTVSFFSGATALVYEITWIRLFSVLFGNSTYAISSVLAVFMGGLALGGYFVGRWIDRRTRPLRAYGFLEIAIGVSALCVPYLIQCSRPLIANLYGRDVPPVLELTLIRAILALAILVVPTLLIGGTLPVLSKCFVESRRQVGNRVGFLYGSNTLGAVFGCAFTGFFFIRFLGIDVSSYLACGVSVLTGIVVLVVEHLDRSETASSRETVPSREGCPVRAPFLTAFLLLAFFLSGFTALSYEVLWARILGFVFQGGMSIYAFTLMLCLFLVGMGLGSLLYSRWLSSHSNPIRLFATLEILTGFSVFFCLYLLSRATDRLSMNLQDFSFLVHAGQAALVLLLPTVLFGMLFPLACELTTGNIVSLGTSLGRAYGFNTMGSVAGPLLTGLVLIPTLGSEISFKVNISANVVIGASLLLLHHDRLRPLTSRLVPSLFSLAVLLLAFRIPLVEPLLNRNQQKVVSFREGPATSVSATETRQGIVLNVGGSVGAGTLPQFRGSTELLAHIPLLLHEQPRDVVVVGFGTGRTPSFLARNSSVDRVDLVEVSEAVFQIGREVFSAYNYNVLDNSKARRIVDDGFNFLQYTSRRYDVVSIDPFTPHTSGSARLYTKDCLEQSRRRLKPGGIVVFWAMPVWAHWRSFLTSLNTFEEVFPHTTVWLTPDERFFVFVGTSRPLVVDVAELRGRLSRRPKLIGGDSYVIRDVADFLRCFFLDESAVRELVAADDLPVFTVNRPNLEFLIHTDRSARIPAEWVRQTKRSILPHLRNAPDDLRSQLGDTTVPQPPRRRRETIERGTAQSELLSAGKLSHVRADVATGNLEATVAHVTDGDSVVLSDDRRVRYLGIDCPEPGDADSERARRLNRRLVEGKRVLLHFHGEKRDQHGRLLALVYVPSPSPRVASRNVSVELLRQGLAWLYLKDASRLTTQVMEPLLAAQREAITQRRGIWKRWLDEDRAGVSSLVSTTGRLHRRGCPLIAGLSVRDVQSLAEELRGGKSPCRKCRPLGKD